MSVSPDGPFTSSTQRETICRFTHLYEREVQYAPAFTFGGAGLGLSLLASLWGRGYAQIIDMEAAKREGELVFYSATRAEDTDQLIKAFTEKYPFIKGTYYRAGGDPLLQRILTEARGGKHLFDVVTALGTQIIMLKDKGLLAPHRSVHQTVTRRAFMIPKIIGRTLTTSMRRLRTTQRWCR